MTARCPQEFKDQLARWLESGTEILTFTARGEGLDNGEKGYRLHHDDINEIEAGLRSVMRLIESARVIDGCRPFLRVVKT